MNLYVRPDGKETKGIVQQAARETTAIIRLISTNVDEAKRSWTHDHCPRLCLIITTGNQWRQDLRNWFSSPDPSTNHIISWGAQHDGTAMWFCRGSLFEEWKLAGSLLWIHGKRTSSNLSLFHSNQTCYVAGAGKSVLWCAVSHLFSFPVA